MSPGSWLSRPAARLALYALALAAVASVAAAVGKASGLGGAENADDGRQESMSHGAEQGAVDPPLGLSDRAAGYRLSLSTTELAAGRAARLRLTILTDDGSPVADLRGEHGEPPLHLILVRRDLGGYLHLHPTRDGRGYVVDVSLPGAGVWRAYADFEVDGEKIVLARDIAASGSFQPRQPPAPTRSVDVDGYRVDLDAKRLAAGSDAGLSFAVSRAGTPLERLQPYLGAAGHLVAIRQNDLAYLHVHPRESAGRGAIAFAADFAAPGRYVLFLQFKHDDSVQTAVFTVEVADEHDGA